MEQSPWEKCLAKQTLQTSSPKRCLSKRTIATANCSTNVATEDWTSLAQNEKRRERKSWKHIRAKVKTLLLSHFCQQWLCSCAKAFFFHFVPSGFGSFLVSNLILKRSSDLCWMCTMRRMVHLDIWQLGVNLPLALPQRLHKNWSLLNHLVSHCSELKCLSKEKKKKRRTKRVRLTWSSIKLHAVPDGSRLSTAGTSKQSTQR